MFKKKQEQTKTEGISQRDDTLFEALGKSKRKKKRRIIRTVAAVVLVIAIALGAGVSILQRRVREQFAASAAEVLSYAATTGTISTVVSGSGTLSNVDAQIVTMPAGVELDELLVEYGDTVTDGQLLATVDMSTVRTAMAELQAQIQALDDQITEAEGDTVGSAVRSGVSGRVKMVYAEADTAVADAMVEHGALAVISLDGCMALDVQTDALNAGDGVTVLRADGEELSGTVESAAGGKATVLVTDNGPENGETVTVVNAAGTELGSGTLYVHNPLSVTGYAGTVSKVHVSENQKISSGTKLLTLTDTGTSANYDALLRSRSEAEQTLLELLRIQQAGGVASPISGSIYSAAGDSTEVATISPDVQMSVTISVDESDILSLEPGQTADVTVSSVSEDTLSGTVTEIDKTAATGSYTAVVTLEKIEGMLPGMTASVDVRIEGVDNAILIPVEAIHQTRDSAYVYTTYDEETQEYGGRVDVVVGLSNNNYAEIKSGLSEGDTVYYTESQSITDLFGGRGGMGFGNMPGGEGGAQVPGGNFSGGEMPGFSGGMPSGGEMPGGDSGSGGWDNRGG